MKEYPLMVNRSVPLDVPPVPRHCSPLPVCLDYPKHSCPGMERLSLLHAADDHNPPPEMSLTTLPAGEWSHPGHGTFCLFLISYPILVLEAFVGIWTPEFPMMHSGCTQSATGPRLMPLGPCSPTGLWHYLNYHLVS